MPWDLVSCRSSRPLLRPALPHLSWEAMPRSTLCCTLAVLCRNVGGVRGPLPGHRQFAGSPLEEAYLRPRQTSYGLGCDREPSRERGSRSLVPSTSTSNRAQAKYRVGCRTRQRERKQQPRPQRDSTWPPTSVVIALRIGGAKARPAAIKPKTSENLPTGGFCPGGGLGFTLAHRTRVSLRGRARFESRCFSAKDSLANSYCRLQAKPPVIAVDQGADFMHLANILPAPTYVRYRG